MKADAVSMIPLGCTSSITLTLGAPVIQDLGIGSGSHQGPAEPPQPHCDCGCQAPAPTPGHSGVPPVTAVQE